MYCGLVSRAARSQHRWKNWRSLAIRGVGIQTRQCHSSIAEILAASVTQSPGTEPERWAQNFDWSRLRRLGLHLHFHTNEPSGPPLNFAKHVAPYLRAVEEVEIKFETCNDQIFAGTAEFLARIPHSALQSISLPTLHKINPSAITAHAAKLRTLSIDRVPLSVRSSSSCVIRSPDWRTSLSLAPAMPSTSGRGVTWPYSILSTLASFPRLCNLEIWFRIGSPFAPHKLYLTMSSAGDIYARLVQNRNSSSPPLSRLHLHSGPPGERYLDPEVRDRWLPKNIMSFMLVREAGIGDGDHADNVALRVALNGPLPATIKDYIRCPM